MDKYIFIKRKVLTKDSCDHLIRVFEKSDIDILWLDNHIIEKLK